AIHDSGPSTISTEVPTASNVCFPPWARLRRSSVTVYVPTAISYQEKFTAADFRPPVVGFEHRTVAV
ncbi:hypothetical protein LCGC14_2171320, partial [marine sediment metagenome]